MIKVRHILLFTVAAALLNACASESKEPTAGSNILIHFDRADYDRMNQFVERFHQGKGDLLMAIPPVFDSGPIIYDLQSNGHEIKVIRDDSRDSYSSSPDKTTYICRAIDWRQEDGNERIALSQCDGVDGDMGLFGFEERR